MRDYPKISVITPSLNSAKYLDCAIQSVLKQDYQNFEHIIVDGESTDETIDIIKKYSHLIWVSEPDKGQSDAMNKGFNLSSGEIIVYLNADDYFEKNAFHTVLPYFKEGAEFVVGKVRVISDDGSCWINDPKTEFHEMLRWWQPNAFCYNPVGYFYLRKIQEIIGGFNADNHFSMDVEFLIECSRLVTLKKIDYILGTFRNFAGTKTFESRDNEPKELKYLNKYVDYLSNADKKKYVKDKNRYLIKLIIYKHINILRFIKNKIIGMLSQGR